MRLPASTPPPSSAPARVCIVTGEFVGPQPCGGIGTAMTGLAHTLAAAGHSVTVLYTRGMWVTPPRRKAWRAEAAARGIDLAFLMPADVGRMAGPLAEVTFTVPSAVLDWLSTRSFDIVHFNEMEADGYLAVAARRFGTVFRETTMVVGLHSPTAWVEDINREITAGALSVVMTAAERLTMMSADRLWSPSNYLLQWVGARGYPLPENVVTQQYVLPDWKHLEGSVSLSNPGKTVRSLVFFGRLEERKGLLIFLDALDMLADELAQNGVEVVFLGKPVLIAGVHSGRLIAERARQWRFTWRLVDGLRQPQAVAFLREPGRLAIMASPADNSPCTVYEAIEYGIPFIAARAGGVPELVHPDDADQVLFEPHATALAARLRDALQRPPCVPRPARTAEERRDAWLASHDPATGWAKDSLRRQVTGRLPIRRSLMVAIQDVGDDAALTRSIASVKAVAHFNPLVTVVSERKLPVHRSPALQLEIEAQSPDHLLRTLRELRNQGACDLLVMTAGVELLADAASMIDQLAMHEPVWLLPSVTLNGRRCDAPPMCVATALAWGANPLGIGLISADILLEGLDHDGEEMPMRGHILGGLLDRALISGAQPHAYPSAMARVGRAELIRSRPANTPERARLFAGASSASLRDFITIAASQGLKPRLPARQALYRVSRTKLSWLAPYLIAVVERLRRFKR